MWKRAILSGLAPREEAMAADDLTMLERVRIGMETAVPIIRAFEQAFGKERVLILLYDDIQADIHKVCSDIFTFLEVDPEFPVDASAKINSIAGEPKVKWIVAGLFSKNRFKRMVSALIPKRLRRIVIRLVFNNLLKREVMDVDTHRQLSEYFEQDILKLEKLIGRDLSGWRS